MHLMTPAPTIRRTDQRGESRSGTRPVSRLSSNRVGPSSIGGRSASTSSTESFCWRLPRRRDKRLDDAALRSVAPFVLLHQVELPRVVEVSRGRLLTDLRVEAQAGRHGGRVRRPRKRPSSRVIFATRAKPQTIAGSQPASPLSRSSSGSSAAAASSTALASRVRIWYRPAGTAARAG